MIYIESRVIYCLFIISLSMYISQGARTTRLPLPKTNNNYKHPRLGLLAARQHLIFEGFLFVMIYLSLLFFRDTNGYKTRRIQKWALKLKMKVNQIKTLDQRVKFGLKWYRVAVGAIIVCTKGRYWVTHSSQVMRALGNADMSVFKTTGLVARVIPKSILSRRQHPLANPASAPAPSDPAPLRPAYSFRIRGQAPDCAASPNCSNPSSPKKFPNRSSS